MRLVGGVGIVAGTVRFVFKLDEPNIRCKYGNYIYAGTDVNDLATTNESGDSNARCVESVYTFKLTTRM